MTDKEAKEVRKLAEKAELTRYIHARIGERRGLQWKVVQTAVGILGMLVSILAAIHYRSGVVLETTEGWGLDDVILLLLIVLPSVATTLVILDSTVWRLRDQEEIHKKASVIWGRWIRRANEAMVSDDDSTSLSETRQRYRRCMKITPNTSMVKFVKYKKEWIRYKNASMDLDGEKLWKSAKEKLGETENQSSDK